MSEQNTIAIICDCDGTLCPDTTELLVSRIGGKPRDFWHDVYEEVGEGWDPPIAYMTKLLELARAKSIGITLDLLKEVGESIRFFPGVLDFTGRLQQRLDANAEFRAARIKIELSIISGGIEEIIKFSAIGRVAAEIFGCSFSFDGKGVANGIKRAVTFTEKTKFVFAINKGISSDELRKKPYRVNDVIDPAERRVPFEHMIYVGDGPSDIPCFSTIKFLEGSVVGVMPPENNELRKPYELSQGDRLTIGPYTTNYNDGTDLYKMLGRYVQGIADNILVSRAQRIKSAPSH
jgi:2-hydroxy-3-keto-5-methylthiopentenyl-1-phosphate phosphatase